MLCNYQYNDSTVVLRELTQNAIDASKLKKHELSKANPINSYIPVIRITWNEKSRELSFIDNGTGMTLEIIQNHLLKVGSSRYQDENFKKQYPDFSPISRFGIGLLTCFLIADDIDIVTKSSDSDRGILLKIKKVHGKYLLKYLSKHKLDTLSEGHGTEIKLYVRADVNLINIEEEIKKWILMPTCNIELDNNGVIIPIGFNNPAELLKHHLQEIGYDISSKNIRVKEVYKDGITLAFALEYIEHWQEWDFIQCHDYDRILDIPIGTCVEGIRVDFDTPGFKNRNLYALVNTSGKRAPKTDVARSNIESTPERGFMLSTIYSLYLEHLDSELQSLIKSGFSVTWATTEINWMLKIFTSSSYHRGPMEIEDQKIFEKSLSNFKCVLVEKSNNRELVSLNELKALEHFWTIDCESYSSANNLIKEVKSSNSSALSLLKNILGTEDNTTDHIDLLLCNQNNDRSINKMIRDNFQVDLIKIIPEQRRLDLRWSLIENKIWEEVFIGDSDNSRIKPTRCYIQLLDMLDTQPIKEIAINSSNALFILKNSELNSYIVKLVQNLSEKPSDKEMILSKVVGLLNRFFIYESKNDLERIIESQFRDPEDRDFEKLIWNYINKDDLINIILKTNFVKYDTTIWHRRNEY